MMEGHDMTHGVGAMLSCGIVDAVRVSWGVVVLFLCVQLVACNRGDHPRPTTDPASDPGRISLEMGGGPVILETAVTEAEQLRGLMYRRELPSDQGMIFIYREPRFLSFWMKDTWIPLSIAFVSDDGTIINIEKMRPLLTQVRYKSEQPCRLAIEMNAGWFVEHHLGPGDRIFLPPEIRSGWDH